MGASGQNLQRQAGVLLHVTSLPAPWGIGDVGPGANRFIDWLAGAGLRLWQVLPLTPPERGNSPYSSFSSFAGNPLLISPERLVEEGYVGKPDLADWPSFPKERVDFPRVQARKTKLLRTAFDRFTRAPAREQQQAFDAFVSHDAQASWLDDFCRFMAIRQELGVAPWPQWPRALAQHDAAALAEWEAEHADAVQFHRFVQFLFFSQWRKLRAYAHKHHVRIIGDLPIYVAHYSADVWANQALFKLDAAGQPTMIAGVPPDYFSPTGQLWETPVYDWAAHERTGFAWWRQRLKAALRTVDVLRLDHFRGFAAFWEVPAGHKDATRGHWSPGPGAKLFRAIEGEIALDRLFAENLGTILGEVEELRQQFGLPGVHVLQFAFAPRKKGAEEPDPTNPNLPFNHNRDAVVYTGTHDNDTTRGWYDAADEAERHIARTYLYSDGGLIHWDMVRAAFSSVAQWAIAPIQDILGLGADARMNTPGVPEGNWAWRLGPELLTDETQEAVEKFVRFYGRAE